MPRDRRTAVAGHREIGAQLAGRRRRDSGPRPPARRAGPVTSVRMRRVNVGSAWAGFGEQIEQVPSAAPSRRRGAAVAQPAEVDHGGVASADVEPDLVNLAARQRRTSAPRGRVRRGVAGCWGARYRRKVAQEVGVLLQQRYPHAGSRQQQAQDHTGRPTTDDRARGGVLTESRQPTLPAATGRQHAIRVSLRFRGALAAQRIGLPVPLAGDAHRGGGGHCRYRRGMRPMTVTQTPPRLGRGFDAARRRRAAAVADWP